MIDSPNWAELAPDQRKAMPDHGLAAVCPTMPDAARIADPFFITGPALISFSGGRTSAYMLWRILQAHGGTLPDNVRAILERGEDLPLMRDSEVFLKLLQRYLVGDLTAEDLALQTPPYTALEMSNANSS